MAASRENLGLESRGEVREVRTVLSSGPCSRRSLTPKTDRGEGRWAVRGKRTETRDAIRVGPPPSVFLLSIRRHRSLTVGPGRPLSPRLSPGPESPSGVRRS